MSSRSSEGRTEKILSSGPIGCRAVAKQVSGVKAGGVSEKKVTHVSVVPCRLHGEVAYRLEGATVGAHPFHAMWVKRTPWYKVAKWVAEVGA